MLVSAGQFLPQINIVEALDGWEEPAREGTVYSVQCTVYSVQCTVYSAQCTVYTVQLG